MNSLRRRVAALDAARARRMDAWVMSLDEADLVAVVEVESVVQSDVRWRGDAECERAYSAVKDAAALVAWDADGIGPWRDPAVRAAARHLVEVVRRAGFEPWGEEHRRTGVR